MKAPTTAHASTGWRVRMGMLSPLGVLLAASAFVALDVADERPVLHAATSQVLDTDGDGLVDPQEKIIGTSLRDTDTDDDGYTDAEEIARNSSPKHARSTPEPRTFSLGSVAHSRDGQIHAVFALYAIDGDFDGKTLSLGALVDGRFVRIPTEVLLRSGNLEILPAKEPGSRIYMFEVAFAPQVVFALGDLTIFAVTSDVVSDMPSQLSALDLIGDRGVIYQRMHPEVVQAGQSMGAGVMVSAFLPIFAERGEYSPSTSTPGEVCVQHSNPVGVTSGVVTNEVVASECQSGWDGFCSSDCANMVGTTFSSIDPVVFTGG